MVAQRRGNAVSVPGGVLRWHRRRVEAPDIPEAIAEKVSWGELGCPQEIGLYNVTGGQVRVKRIHIIVAENDPGALFTVVELRPPLGPPEYMLGHRVA